MEENTLSSSIAKLKGKVRVSKPKKKVEIVPPTPKLKKPTIGNLSLEDTEKLFTLEFTDGTPLLTKQVTYEVLALIREVGFSATYQFLTSRPWENENELILSLPNLHEARERGERDIIVSQEKINAATGIDRCNYCGSNRTVTVSKQIRACDEPATQIVTCLDCGRKRRYG